MKTDSQEPQPETHVVTLTTRERSMVVFALGMVAGSFGLDEKRNPTPAMKMAGEIAQKFGVQ
jgi:hypothetical protein